MFCPKCGAEYRNGFTVCADCDVPLVHEPPQEVHTEVEFVHYVEVLRTFNLADVALIKSVLDAEGITYYFKGENFMFVRPLADPAALMVKEDEVERVRETLKDLRLEFKGIPTPDDRRGGDR